MKRFLLLAAIVVLISLMFGLDTGIAQPEFDCSNVTEIPQVECEALISFYNSTGGEGWNEHTNWLLTTTPCNWFGVGCDDNGHVQLLSLGFNNLVGSIPAALGNISKLRALWLDMNALSGSIPTELGNLSELDYIRLNGNQLTGSIPAEFGNLGNLRTLKLSGNQLTGSIPVELGNLTSLNFLDLSGNQLSGSIPGELGNNFNLLHLDLGGNQLTGSIPAELSNLSSLGSLLLWGNQLTGSIPPELGNLHTLEYLFFSDNQLTGSIPVELGNLDNLLTLNLSGNQLTGSILVDLGYLGNLGTLVLSGNQLTGSIPVELGNLGSLGTLQLSGNQLTGSIPVELGNLGNLGSLQLSGNQLTGSIPAELGNLGNLGTLQLSGNQLTGSIPPELGLLSNLKYLDLSNNQLSGSIPPGLGNLIILENLMLYENQLSGPIPLNFIDLTSLWYFSFWGTSICEPATLDFLAWKETVTYWNGTDLNCETTYYSISGRIVDSSGEPISGVRVSIDTGEVDLTDSIGNYSFINLSASSYTITPYLSGYTFSPSQSTVTLPPDAIGLDFVGTENILGEAPWLLMYYMAGDIDYQMDLELTLEISDIIAHSYPNVDIAIFHDSKAVGTFRRFISSTGNETFENSGDLNSGDGYTLSNFILWAKSQSTAENTALIIADHGHGLTGVALDNSDEDNVDRIELVELHDALATSGRIDVLYLHACLMGNIESMWQLRGLTDYYVASESIMWLPISHSDYLSNINTDTTPKDVALGMASSYYESASKFSSPSTISVADISQIYSVHDNVNAFSTAIMGSPNRGAIWEILAGYDLQRFDDDLVENDPNDKLADLYHFVELVSTFPDLEETANRLLETQSQFILYNKFWDGCFDYKDEYVCLYHADAKGVSVALPTNRISFYVGDFIEFAEGADWNLVSTNAELNNSLDAETTWGQMISALVLEYNPDDPDEPYPPELVAPLISSSVTYLPMVTKNLSSIPKGMVYVPASEF